MNNFLIVGIGASAGGVQALKEFFEQVPEHSGLAYVVILHLSPDYESHLTEVLQATAKIPVIRVDKKAAVKSNHVYVVPPNKHLTMQGDDIIVSGNTVVEDRRAPVDIFFRSLAESHRERAICVILSGTGADGSMGLKRIKENGGTVYVQNPREAEFNEMPRSAIATDLVDQVLNVAEIPAQLMAYKDSLGTVHIPIESAKRDEDQLQALREIFSQLRIRTGHDFSNYKRPTLLRRIERRINMRSLPDLPAYAAYLQEQPEETISLLKDLLISVTNFFRDKDAFQEIEKEIIPKLIKVKKGEQQIRVWVAGCATGEEAYSLAMLFAEQIVPAVDGPKVQIFATDIDETALAAGREGLYTLNDAADVSPERLQRFFTKEGDSYRIRGEIREMVLFAHHNFLKDPPFSRLDLVTCRNVLIYLNQAAQERVMETFQFALNPGGYLFLGTAETVDGSRDLFASVSREHHIYQSRLIAARKYIVPESIPIIRREHKLAPAKPEANHSPVERISYGELHQRLLEQYAPPSLIVNENYDIVHMTDRVGRFLQMAGGELSQNLLKLIAPELRLELRSALYQAVQRNIAVDARGLNVKIGEREEIINIIVRPVFQDSDLARGFILVVFEPATERQEVNVVVSTDEPIARQLEEELTRLKTQLRNSNEGHEFQAEELKASNEELQAMNEELRSSTEELETSKEELQSMNEELTTVNQELKIRVEEVSVTNNNLQNLINSTDIGTIFLDRGLRVMFFTPAARGIFNLIPADYGRPISDITSKLANNSILDDAEIVLERLQTIEREMQLTDGKYFLIRLSPYRTADDRIQGVVAAFIDITKRRNTELALAEAQQRLEVAHEAAGLGVWDVDFVTYKAQTSPRHDRIFGYSTPLEGWTEELFRNSILQEDRELFDQAFARALNSGVLDVRVRIVWPDDSVHWVYGRGRVYYNEQRKPLRMAGVTMDITEHKEAEEALRLSKERLQRAMEIETVGIIFFGANGTISESNDAFLAMSGYDREDLRTGTLRWDAQTAPDSMNMSVKATGELRQYGRTTPYEKQYVRKDGSRWWGLFSATRISDEENVEFVVDITEQKRAETELRSSEERIRLILESAKDYAIFTLSLERNVKTWSSGAQRIFSYSEAEMIGRSGDILFVPEDRADGAPVREAEKALAEGRAENERWHARQDGSTFYGSGLTMPMLDEGGRAIGFVKIMRDLTEQKQAEEKLRESEARLRIMMDSAVDYAIIYTDANGAIQSWNSGAARIFGYDENEVIGKPTDLIFIPEDVAAGAPQQEMRTAREQGRAADERWHIRRNGERFYMSGVMRPILNPELSGYIKVARDMTEHKEAEEALRISEERYRVALQSAEMGAWDWHIPSNQLVCNPQHYRMMGLEPVDGAQDAIAMLDHVLAEDKLRMHELLDKAVANLGTYQAEYRIVRADNGRVCWMSNYGKVVASENGKAIRMLGVMHDITDRKALERQKDDFISIASHELRTPVAGIKAYGELLYDLHEEAGDEEKTALISKLNGQVDRMTALIRDLLDITTLAEGKLTLRKQLVDINTLTERSLEELQRTTRHRLVLELSEIPEVQADPDRIMQVIMNLVSNAIKYSPDTEQIIIRTTANNDEVVFAVQDFGIGIPEEMKTKVFDRFFRVVAGRDTTYPGLGLGLYIASELVHGHNGRIWVESEEGKGSTFHFALPIAS